MDPSARQKTTTKSAKCSTRRSTMIFCGIQETVDYRDFKMMKRAYRTGFSPIRYALHLSLLFPFNIFEFLQPLIPQSGAKHPIILIKLRCFCVLFRILRQRIRSNLVNIIIQPVRIQRVRHISPQERRNRERIVVLVVVERKCRIQTFVEVTVILIV